MANADDSYTVYFSDVAPKGHESNGVQTNKGKTFNVIFRNYAPTEAWFDETWKVGDFQPVN